MLPGLAGEKQVLHMLHQAFLDLRIIIADEHNAVIRRTMPVTRQGMFRGVQPNGEAVQFTSTDIPRIDNGKVVARWDEMNDRAAPPYV
jgi:predicted ester cyclase